MPITERQPSRRDRKRQRTRTELVGAARALIAENGVSALRVSDVTERTDVALGSFYSHFESKDAIVEAVVADAVSDLADALRVASADIEDPAEAMALGARQLVAIGRDEPELARLLLALDHPEDRFRAIIWPRAMTVMQRGIDSGRFTTESPELLLSLAIAGVFAALQLSVESPDLPDIASRCASALLRLVGVDHDSAEEIAHRPLPRLDQGGADGRADALRHVMPTGSDDRVRRIPPRHTSGDDT